MTRLPLLASLLLAGVALALWLAGPSDDDPPPADPAPPTTASPRAPDVPAEQPLGRDLFAAAVNEATKASRPLLLVLHGAEPPDGLETIPGLAERFQRLDVDLDDPWNELQSAREHWSLDGPETRLLVVDPQTLTYFEAAATAAANP